jgi:hypothetical protein
MASFEFELLPPGSDLEVIAPLWERSTDWGKLTPELLARFGVDSPSGAASAVTARAESGEIVGAIFFIPQTVIVRGTQMSAHRPSATLLDPSVRFGIIHSDPRRHPIMGMYYFGADHFRSAGDALLVTVPNPRWGRILKSIPGMKTAKFPLMSLPLPLAEPLPWDDAYSAHPLTSFDTRVDTLGQALATQYSCAIRRDARALEWKMSRGDVVMTGVERDGELIGVVASRKKGFRQWLVCELLSADSGEALTMTLIAAANVANAHALVDESATRVQKVGILATPLMTPALERLGFRRDDYEFPLAVHQLDASLSTTDIAPEGWYVAADD